MIDFGFGFSPSSRIDLDKASTNKLKELIRIEPDIQKCMACGSCCGSCTGSQFTDVSLRSCILKLQNGQEEEALALLKSCMLCGKCTLVCPRNINTRHLILSINKIYCCNDNK